MPTWTLAEITEILRFHLRLYLGGNVNEAHLLQNLPGLKEARYTWTLEEIEEVLRIFFGDIVKRLLEDLKILKVPQTLDD